jgi:hypothetical protein
VGIAFFVPTDLHSGMEGIFFQNGNNTGLEITETCIIHPFMFMPGESSDLGHHLAQARQSTGLGILIQFL